MNIPEGKVKKGISTILVIGLTVVTMLALCAVTYYFLDDQLKCSYTATPSQSGESVLSNHATNTATSNIIADVKNLELNDKIANWTLTGIKKFTDTMADTSMISRYDLWLSNNNVILDFSGKATISGSYRYNPPSEESTEISLEFDLTDKNEIKKIPVLASQPNTLRFSLDVQKAAALLGFETDEQDHSGTATIVIDRYILVSYPTEATNSANIIGIE